MELTAIESHKQELPAHARSYQGGFVKLNDGRFVLVVRANNVADIHLATQEKIEKLATILPKTQPFYYQYDETTQVFSLEMGTQAIEISLNGEPQPSIDLSESLASISWSSYWPLSRETTRMVASTALFAISLKLRECLQA